MFFSLGLVLVIGAHRRWNWLVDPDLRMWPFYSQALLKKVFGKRFVVAYTYCVGFLMMLFSVIGLINVLRSMLE